MKQYLLSVHHDSLADYQGENLAPGQMETMIEQVGALNAELMDTGAWVFGGGLAAPDTATTVRETGGEIVMTDGPYAETKEFIGGFWIIQAEDLDAALDWAKKATVACQDPVEVRPFQEEPPS